MKYFANYEADAVVREDDNGVRYIKEIDNLKEGRVGKDHDVAWGIPSYGVHNFLEPITKEEYDNFGITWDW
ncbi:MAG: hypothetical protein GX800_06615, partial [Clostridiaceae bacterium]|nr:hypothetical protein [Clostridiaceae bacterium]